VTVSGWPVERIGVGCADVTDERDEASGMTICAHCKRELVGVATIFPETPAVCGRADCLLWALHGHRGVKGQVIDLDEARAAREARPAAA
jgi:hypothetical protein